MTDTPSSDIALKPKPKPCIYQIIQHRNHDGCNIIENKLIDGDELPEGVSRFVGQAFVDIQQGPHKQRAPVPFDIDADTIQRAFGLFMGLAQAAATQFRDNLIAQQRRIQTASPDQMRGIVGPDGNYLTPPS